MKVYVVVQADNITTNISCSETFTDRAAARERMGEIFRGILDCCPIVSERLFGADAYSISTINGNCYYGEVLGIEVETPTEEKKTAHWEYDENDHPKCSACGATAGIDSWEHEMRDKIRYELSAFCPNCGAAMT